MSCYSFRSQTPANMDLQLDPSRLSSEGAKGDDAVAGEEEEDEENVEQAERRGLMSSAEDHPVESSSSK